tara:strand:+ start:1664 stop:2668 length:1005 start_codon:yes stop_codon:yes gene_type:complete
MKTSLPDQTLIRGGSSLSLVTARWKYLIKQAIQWAVVLATAGVLFRVARRHQADLTSFDLSFNVFWLLHAAIATTVANLLLPLGWRLLVASFGHVLASGRAVRLWCLAQTARYLPTGLVAIASRMQLALKEGVSRPITAASIAVETAALFAWALLVCAFFVPSDTFHSALRWGAGGVSLIVLLSMPWLIAVLGKRFSSLRHVRHIEPERKLITNGLALLGASVAARAIGTVCLAASVLNIDSTDIPLVLGAAYAAVVAGMVGVTPAGLGVREGVMTAILAPQFGVGDAAAFALFTRVWEFGFELLFLAVASWWGRKTSSKVDPTKDLSVSEGKL